ncbi:MAG: epoxyqueuosine reductase QueH [Thermodesulfovibrionia bacterium]|nr:epoxyqueuosine reductase QueH [Thermodesulfovibrionia bacterium]
MKILLHICCSSCALYPVKIIREEGHDFTGFWFNPNIQPYEEYELRLNSLKDLAERWRIDMIYADEYAETRSEALSPVIARDEVPKQSHWIGAGLTILKDEIASLEPALSEKDKILRGVYPEQKDEILRFAQNDMRRAQNDRSEGARNDKKVVFSKQIPQRFGIESQRPGRCKSCYRLRLGKTAEEAQRQGFDAFSTTLLISPYQDFEQIISIGSELAEKHNVIFYFRDFRQYFREAMAYAKEMGLYRQKYCGCIYSRDERFSRKRELNPKA